MYVVVEFLDAEPKHRASLRSVLVVYAHQVLTRGLGCQTFDVGQDDLDGNAFLLYQRYDDKLAHLANLEHPAYAEHRLLIDAWIHTRRTLTYECVSDAGVA